jgi:osmotically-inducible protein OsmY
MEHRGPFGSRYEDEDERRRDFERGWEGRRYRGEAYSGGYYGAGRGDHGGSRGDWREPHDRNPRDRDREGGPGRREGEHGRDERNFMDRVTDEVRSWFGDEEAERRRRQDFREMYGREGRDERDTWDRGRAPAASDWAGSPRGPYAGRGPRGYQRSDDRIREDVCERLSRHGMLDASDVDVTVTAGEVTLRGSVPSRWAKREAEDLTDSVSGVRDVHNELRVSPPGAPTSGASHAQPGDTTQPGTTPPPFGRTGHEGEQRGRVA